MTVSDLGRWRVHLLSCLHGHRSREGRGWRSQTALKASLGSDPHLAPTLSWPEPFRWPCPMSQGRGRESPNDWKERRAGVPHSPTPKD